MMGWQFNGVITLTVFIYVYNVYCVCFELSIYGVSCECVCVCVYRCGHFPETAGLPPNASHDLVAESTCTGCCCQNSQWRRQTQETQCCDEPYFNNTFCSRTFNSCQWVNIKTHGCSITYHVTGTPKHVSTHFANSCSGYCGRWSVINSTWYQTQTWRERQG